MGKLYRLPRSHSNFYLRVLPLLGIFTLTFLLAYAWAAEDSAAALTLKQGSFGQEVKALQKELQIQGFYSGEIDGVYGANTRRAVSVMQQKYGLKADGVAGPETLKALGLADNSAPADDSPAKVAGAQQDNSQQKRAIAGFALSPDEITLLARAISAEAGDEPYIAKVAIGAVLLNRLDHSSFPNTLAAVIYQPLELESVADGRINNSADQQSLEAARDAASGWDPSYGCLYFWNSRLSGGEGIWPRRVAVTYGNYQFGI